MADLFWIAALSFLPKGIGGGFVDYSGYSKEHSELVYSECCFVLLLNKNHIATYFLQFNDLKNRFQAKKEADVYKTLFTI